MLKELARLSLESQRHDGVAESARVEVKAGWLRFGLALLMSPVLAQTVGLLPAMIWLVATLALDGLSYFLVRAFLGAGGGMLRSLYRLNSFLVCISWTAFPVLIWFSGGEAARLAAVSGIFALALYTVMVCHHDARMLAALLLPPSAALTVMLTLHAQTGAANMLLMLQSSLGFVAVLAITGWLCHTNYIQYADSQESLARERNLLERRVAERTAELEGAMVRAEAAHAVKAQFLAKMSHELRTPLNAIINYAEIVQEDLGAGGDNVASADVQRIHAAGRHLLALIEDLLSASSIEAGAMSADRAMVNLGALLREVAGSIANTAERRGNLVDVSIGGGLESVWTDAKLLRQCTLNLLSNACKFTEAGHIRLDAHCEGRMLIIEVTDTGIGIAPGQLSTLFQPFSQGDNSITRQFGGAGLGLVITRRMAEVLEGTLTCESKLGEGARFTLRLPRIDPPLARAA